MVIQLVLQAVVHMAHQLVLQFLLLWQAPRPSSPHSRAEPWTRLPRLPRLLLRLLRLLRLPAAVWRASGQVVRRDTRGLMWYKCMVEVGKYVGDVHVHVHLHVRVFQDLFSVVFCVLLVEICVWIHFGFLLSFENLCLLIKYNFSRCCIVFWRIGTPDGQKQNLQEKCCLDQVSNPETIEFQIHLWAVQN